MFFDKRIIFRLRQDEYKILQKFVFLNPDIESISHLARVALMKYLKDEIKRIKISIKENEDYSN